MFTRLQPIDVLSVGAASAQAHGSDGQHFNPTPSHRILDVNLSSKSCRLLVSATNQSMEGCVQFTLTYIYVSS